MQNEKYLPRISDIENMGIEEALIAIANLIDQSTELKDSNGLAHCQFLARELLKKSLNPVQCAKANYHLGNACFGLGAIKAKGNGPKMEWELPDIAEAVLSYRRALFIDDLPEKFMEIRLKTYTNLGNAFSHLGRSVEAIDSWTSALSIDPGFAMALGNRAYGMLYYARLHYDKGQAAVMYKITHQWLTDALKGKLESHATEFFQAALNEIERFLRPDFIGKDINLDNYPLGSTSVEVKYRQWCLKNRLFLNPLNDLGPYAIAARDTMTCPGIVVSLHEGPYYLGCFNQMKQEYASARFLFYDGLTSEVPHYSDRDVRLYNTLDYPVYCLAIEKQKLAFRSAYSILDKVAFFMNKYLNLGIKEYRIKFKSFWYPNQDDKQGILEAFLNSGNWPFRGLYWLSRDLYPDRAEEAVIFESMEPEARLLAEIRNQLEHRYLKVHDPEWPGRYEGDDLAFRALEDSMAYPIYRAEFESKTLKLLKIVRAALIYLPLGIHLNELKKRKNHKGLIGRMETDIYDDDWKR